MEISEEFKNLYDLVEHTASNVFLTGKAGTGKTTFLKYLREHSAKRMVVAAPTGVAAINAGGVTLHSLFQLPFEPFLPGVSRPEKFNFSREKLRIIRSLDLLVIDEISMVRADLLDAVDDVLRFARKNQNAFGGLQLLLIGDMQQLPPVLTNQEENMLRSYYQSSYFFNSHALSKAGYCCVELTKVYRQTETRFIDLLNAVRTNSITSAQLQELNSHYVENFEPDELENYIRLTTHNYKAKVVNEQKLEELGNPAFSFRATVTGTFPESSYPTDEVLTLKKGAQVMFIKNDPQPEKAYYNGKIGVVSAISEDNILVTFPDGTSANAVPLDWKNVQYELNENTRELEEKEIGSFQQVPLRLAWAITIHKSQGLTFDKVLLDAGNAFAHGQVYVALSRCRTLEGLVLNSPLPASAIKTDDVVLSFSDDMKAKKVSSSEISLMEKAYFDHLLTEQFDFTQLNGTLLMLVRLINENFSHLYDDLAHLVKKQHQQAQTEIVDVSAKFQKQALALSQKADPLLQERISKASAYFLSKIEEILNCLPERLKVDSVRKDIKKRYTALCEDFKLQLDVKRLTLKKAETAFSVEQYLKTKAFALSGETEQPAKKGRDARRKTSESKPSAEKKAPAEKKIPTVQVSYDLYKQGKTPEQIAEERQLKVETILSHLSTYVANGELAVTDFVPKERVEVIGAYLDAHPDVAGLSAVREAIGEDYSYGEIKMVWSMPKYHQS